MITKQEKKVSQNHENYAACYAEVEFLDKEDNKIMIGSNMHMNQMKHYWAKQYEISKIVGPVTFHNLFFVFFSLSGT